MTELSPAANAILEAYDNSPWEYDTGDLTACAAVLRAVADQVVPKEWPTIEDYNEYDQGFAAAQIKHRNQILAIADEIKA